MKVLCLSIVVFLSFVSFAQEQVDTLYKYFPKENKAILVREEFDIKILNSGHPFVLNTDVELPKGVKLKTVPDSIPVGKSGKLVVYLNRKLNKKPVVLIDLVEKYNTPAKRIVKLVFEQEKIEVQERPKLKSVVIKGKVFDAKSKSTIVGEVSIMDIKSRDKVSFKTNSSGEFITSSLSPTTEYIVQVGATNCRIQVDTLKKSELVEEVFSKNYYLEKFEAGQTIPLENVLFVVGTNKMLPTSYAALDGLFMMMKLNLKMEIRVDGHTDNTAGKSSSLKLSKARANAVKFYLTRRGVEEKRISTNGVGSAHPVVPNDSEDNKRKNRRVEFVILKI